MEPDFQENARRMRAALGLLRVASDDANTPEGAVEAAAAVAVREAGGTGGLVAGLLLLCNWLIGTEVRMSGNRTRDDVIDLLDKTIDLCVAEMEAMADAPGTW